MTKSVKELENILQYEFKNKDLLTKLLHIKAIVKTIMKN